MTEGTDNAPVSIEAQIQSSLSSLAMAASGMISDQSDQSEAIGNLAALFGTLRGRVAYWEGVAVERQKFIDYLIGDRDQGATDAVE